MTRRIFQRVRLGASVLALMVALGGAAVAEPVIAKDGRFEADVSSTQMSRVSIAGEKVVSIRKVDDPEGPQIMLEAEEGTGDVFVAFDGDVAGRSFSVFLVTESGKTVQAILRPTPGEGQTVLVKLGEASASAERAPATAAVGLTASASPAGAPRSDRRAPYPETLVAFIRLMFIGETPEGVGRRAGRGETRRAGPFEISLVETYEIATLRGQVLSLTNASKVDAQVTTDSFVVAGVLAAATTRERLGPGEVGRVYIVEEVQ